MPTLPLSRRQWLAGTAGLAGLALSTTSRASTSREANAGPFRFCLNTSTIRGQNLTVVEQAEVTAKAGYDAIEPWIPDLDKYVEGGGSLPDLAKRYADLGLTVESVIGFPEWIVDDEARRTKGLEEARRGMEIVRTIGGKRLAAPPVGATELPELNLDRAAERYVALLEVGRQFEVAPMLEVWGFSKNLRTLAQTAYVALSCGQADASVLPDVYHLYKGGSPFEGVGLLTPAAVQHFHVNDYPDIPPDKIGDADRIFTGDGMAPLPSLLKTLHGIGYRGCLSLELFNRDYWKRDALEVASEGLAKMKKAVEAAGLATA
jgi:sugar phosphate isomerase/epimerase